jgi:hypothetical protein
MDFSKFFLKKLFIITMKRKITYLIKDFDKIMREILPHTGDFRKEVLLLQRKQEFEEIIDKMAEKYDKIIELIEKEKELPDEV